MRRINRNLVLGFFLLYVLSIHYYSRSSSQIDYVIVVNNRVPRCASTLMSKLFSNLSSQTNTFEYVNDDGEHRLSSWKQTDLKERMTKLVHRSYNGRLVFVKHFHFFPLRSAANTTFYYINQLRDPMDRLLSNYNYKRYKCMSNNQHGSCDTLDETAVKLNLDRCLSGTHPERCITKKNGIQSAIAYFCGQADICDDTEEMPNSREALVMAKLNIERHYHHVGLVEYLTSSLELLEYKLPVLFSGITKLYREMDMKRVHSIPKNYRVSISNQSKRILYDLLWREYELYYFAKQRFVSQYTKTFLRLPLRENVVD